MPPSCGFPLFGNGFIQKFPVRFFGEFDRPFDVILRALQRSDIRIEIVQRLCSLDEFDQIFGHIGLDRIHDLRVFRTFITGERRRYFQIPIAVVCILPDPFRGKSALSLEHFRLGRIVERGELLRRSS